MSFLQEDQTTGPLWQRRFRAPTIAEAHLARHATEHGMVSINTSGVCQLYVWETTTGKLTQLTTPSLGVATGLLSPDGTYVYYLDDQTGNELGHVVRVSFQGGTPQDLTPGFPPYPLFGLAIDQKSTMLALISASKGEFQLWIIPLHAGETPRTPRLLYSGSALMRLPYFSANGEVIVVTTNERTGRQQFGLLALDTATGDRIGALQGEEGQSITGGIFSPRAGDPRLITISNKTGTFRPLLWHPFTGECVELIMDALQGDITIYDWSSKDDHILLGCSYHAKQQLLIYDLQEEKLTPLQTPGGNIADAFFGPEAAIWCLWSDASHPQSLMALTDDLLQPVLATEHTLAGRSMQNVRFSSSDGQMIQGWLGVPDGTGPFPTILQVHGGPFSVVTDTFAPEAQSWLEHGFAFLSINYRGSTTFGRTFQTQILGQLGYWEIEDIVAAHTWLIEQGIANQKQIFLMGWSYGGYLTLLALGKYATLWAGGMAGSAIVDWSIQYEDTPDTFKAYTAFLFGGKPEQMIEQYHMSSPVTFLPQVVAPALIIQGYNDARCPSRQMQAYWTRAQELGKVVEIHWYDGGHKSRSVEQRIEHHKIMLTFVMRILASAQ